jgi:hypothetical protein
MWQGQDNWIVTPAPSGHKCRCQTSTQSMQRSCLYSTTPFLIERSLFLFRRGPSIPKLWAIFFLTWSMKGDQVSRVSRVTPRLHIVSAHWIGYLKRFIGWGWMKHSLALAKIIAVLLRHLWLFSTHSINAKGHWGRIPGSWWAVSAWRTWL